MDQEVEILKRRSVRNYVRVRSLVALDGFTWDTALQFDELERRECCLMDIRDIRKLTEPERQELAQIGRELNGMQAVASVQR